VFDQLRALSTRQQVLVVAALVASVCLILASVWYLFLRVSYQPLFTQLRSTDAAAIIADLERKKISYELADGGSTILVPADVADRTRIGVMTEDLPLKGTVGFELFDKSDMGLTDFAQKINYQRALQGELERTIATLDGVDSARVHLSLGEDRIFRDDRVPPKASVTVRMQKNFVLAANTAQGIQRLIAAAVPNLDAANVVILDEKGLIVGPAAQAHPDLAVSQPADQEKQAIELYYQARAGLAVDHAYPLSGITIKVSTDADGQLNQTQGGTDWNPQSRSFPLRVTISSNPLDSVTRESVRDLVAGAIGSDAGKNDTIDFVMAPAPAPDSTIASNRRPARMRDVVDGLQPPAFDNIQSALVVLVFSILIGIILIFAWRMRHPKRLSETQRAELAARFSTLLEQEGGHVVS
jgi:flagellar M-ring protein FliF